jgi:hypothetical protein
VIVNVVPSDDPAAIHAEVERLRVASWCWWYAAKLQDPRTSLTERRRARAYLLDRLGEVDYYTGRIEPANPGGP